jgi:DNA-binding transcriptional regulator LsrR (DeoR family)
MGKTKIDFTNEQLKLIATRYALGATHNQLAEEFAVSRFTINRILAKDEARQVIKDVSHEIVTMEIAQNRRAVAELLPKAVEVLLDQLNQKNLKAAEIVIRASGMLTPEDKSDQKQQQSIQVILPGATKPRDVVAE